MGSLVFGPSPVQALVESTFNERTAVARSAFSDARNVEAELIALIAQASGLDVSVILPINRIDIPADPSYTDMLTTGSTGMSADVEDAIFSRGVERSSQLLADSLDRIRNQWSEFGAPLPDGVLTSMLMAEIDKFDQERLDLNRQATEQSYKVAAEFARFAVELVNNFKIEMLKAQIGQETTIAALLQARGEFAITEFVEKIKVLSALGQSVAGIATQIASAAYMGLNVSASIGDSHSASESESNSYTSSSAVSESSSSSESVQNADGSGYSNSSSSSSSSG